MVKITVVFSLILTFFGASMYYSSFKSDDYEKLANKITIDTSKKIQDEKGLILIGTGGRMMEDIKMMMMGFNYEKVVDIAKARKLLVESVEEYLSEINSNDKIRQYLHNYPFSAKNIQIIIYFGNPDDSKVVPEEITLASAKEGKMFYYIDYPEKYTLKTIYEETYEEALRIISSQ